jgi:hypothetical protein
VDDLSEEFNAILAGLNRGSLISAVDYLSQINQSGRLNRPPAIETVFGNLSY